MSDEPADGNVGQTAVGAAMMRTRESERVDRLFEDPLAARFVAAADVFAEVPDDPSGALEELETAFADYVATRTRFFDDRLGAATEAGCRQFVFLAAGLDARAFRREWPEGARVIEVDLPGVLDFKQQVLDIEHATARCDRRVVPVDLRADWTTALLGALDVEQPVFWLAEGLFEYLSATEIALLLTRIETMSAEGSHLAFDPPMADTQSITDATHLDKALDRVEALFGGAAHVLHTDTLEEAGWTVRHHDQATLQTTFNRISVGLRLGADYFVTATKQESSPQTHTEASPPVGSASRSGDS